MSNFFYTLANKALETIKPYTPGRPIEEIRKKLGLRSIIKLASNESPFTPSAAVRKAVLAEMDNINRYPYSGCPFLAADLARRLQVSPQQIVFGNGSDELITVCIKSFITGPDDEVIVAHPTFLIYALQSALAGARVITVPMKEYRYDLPAMASQITARTKIVFIANPDNPTGSYITERQLKEFMEKVSERVVVFVDEAYFEFAAEEKRDYPNTIPWLKKYKNLIITRTFSKAYGLAGLRLGYSLSCPEIAEIFNKVREPFNINRIADVAARTVLKEQARILSGVRRVLREKKKVAQALTRCGVAYQESATNFILVFLDDAEQFVEYALKKGVIIRSMQSWGISGAFRVTIGMPQENKRFITVLERFLSERGNRT